MSNSDAFEINAKLQALEPLLMELHEHLLTALKCSIAGNIKIPKGAKLTWEFQGNGGLVVSLFLTPLADSVTLHMTSVSRLRPQVNQENLTLAQPMATPKTL
jgi:hypothetical protein